MRTFVVVLASEAESAAWLAACDAALAAHLEAQGIVGAEAIAVPLFEKDKPTCSLCSTRFTTTNRRHHCRVNGELVCNLCSKSKCDLAARANFGKFEPFATCACATVDLPHVGGVIKNRQDKRRRTRAARGRRRRGRRRRRARPAAAARRARAAARSSTACRRRRCVVGGRRAAARAGAAKRASIDAGSGGGGGGGGFRASALVARRGRAGRRRRSDARLGAQRGRAPADSDEPAADGLRASRRRPRAGSRGRARAPVVQGRLDEGVLEADGRRRGRGDADGGGAAGPADKTVLAGFLWEGRRRPRRRVQRAGFFGRRNRSAGERARAARSARFSCLVAPMLVSMLASMLSELRKSPRASL